MNKYLKILYLKQLNRDLCDKRKVLLKLEEDHGNKINKDLGCILTWYNITYLKILNEIWELGVKIEANGREILRLRGNKWSF